MLFDVIFTLAVGDDLVSVLVHFDAHGSSQSGCGLLELFDLGAAEVAELQVVVLVEEQIGRLQVSVGDALAVHVLQDVDYFCGEELHQFLLQFAFSLDDAEEFSIWS